METLRTAVTATGTGSTTPSWTSFLPLIIILVLMYFLLIRPQRKRDKETQKMRGNLQVGDEIVTIGGIIGKVVKTKEESIVIQVGADKTKLEIMKWGVSSVTKQAGVRTISTNDAEEETVEKEAQPKKKLPKKLTKTEEVEADIEKK